MKKVLIAITKSNWGGAQRYVFDLATSLPKDAFEVTVAFGGSGLPHAGPGRLKTELEAHSIRTITLTKLARDIFPLLDLAAFAELYRILKCEQPDILHTNSSKIGGIGAVAGRLAGVPKIVFTSHGLVYDEDRPSLARVAIWILTWITFLCSHQVIVLSQDNLTRAKRLPFCLKKIVLVYNGIRPATLKNRIEAQKALAPNFSNNVPWIGTISELTKNKYLDRLIRAVGILSRKGLNFCLCIIGEGEERHALEAIIKEEKLGDRMRLAGFVSGGASYLSAFDIFTLTSIKEGLPYVLMEAGNASLATVGSNIPGIVDIIEDNVTGLLTIPGNANDLAEKLERLLNDTTLRERLGTELELKIQKKFSINKMVSETALIYLQ